MQNREVETAIPLCPLKTGKLRQDHHQDHHDVLVHGLNAAHQESRKRPPSAADEQTSKAVSPCCCDYCWAARHGRTTAVLSPSGEDISHLFLDVTLLSKGVTILNYSYPICEEDLPKFSFCGRRKGGTCLSCCQHAGAPRGVSQSSPLRPGPQFPQNWGSHHLHLGQAYPHLA